MNAPAADIPEMPTGGSVDIAQLTKLFASKAALNDLEKRLSACEVKNDS